MAKRRIIFVSVVCLSIAVFSMQALIQAAEISQFDKKITESLNIRWRSIVYSKVVYNPAVTSNKRRQPQAEGLRLSCEIDVPDSGPVLNLCLDAVVEQVTDSRGRNIEFKPSSSRPTFYRSMPRVPKRFMTSGGPYGLQYNTLKLGLDAGLCKKASGEIGIKGYFYVIVAESFDYVDLPFEPNDNWVSITPDVEVRVRQARNFALRHQFDIEQRPDREPNLQGLRVGDFLPSRLVTDRQIIVQTSAMGTGGGGSFGRIGGGGSGTGRAEKIRFTVAVNPVHRKIPIELEQIPLPAFTEPAPSQSPSSNRTEPTPFKSMPKQIAAQFDEKVANCFEVDWDSILYNKTLNNPLVSTNSEDQLVSEKLYVRCQAKILDPELIVGMCDMSVIEQITDSNGQYTDISRAQPHLNRMYYNTPRYRPSVTPIPPSKLIQLESKARTALGMPLLARHRPKRILELQPVDLLIELDSELIRQDPGEIGCIKGYFHALTARSLKHVKIPFKSSDKWVRLTPDVEIQLPKVQQSRFEIKQRRQAGRQVSRLLVGDQWPSEIVADYRFIWADDWSNSPRSRGGQQLPASINSGGSTSGRKVEEIDFVIAVGPTHNRIPFEIEHIPLPKP